MSSAPAKGWPQLILFGDSQFQRGFANGGIASRLADALQRYVILAEFLNLEHVFCASNYRRVDVVNRGFSGYNTNLAKILLPQVFPKESLQNVAGIVIWFGSNDSALAGDARNNQNVPLEQYRKNLEDIVAYFTVRKSASDQGVDWLIDTWSVANLISGSIDWLIVWIVGLLIDWLTFVVNCFQGSGVPKERIILASPAPVHPEIWEDFCRATGKDSCPRSPTEVVEKYAGVVYEVAKTQSVLFGDVYERMLNSGKGDSKDLFTDGLHLSESGAEVVFDVLHPVVERVLKSHPLLYPDWATIDFRNPSMAPWICDRIFLILIKFWWII